MENTKITITASVSADPAKVWECYTAPEHIIKWNFAADTWHCPSASSDLKAGGRFTARMEAKDGSFGFDFEGIYDEIIPNKKLSYTMPDGRRVEVNFREANHRVEVEVSFDAEKQHPIEMQRDGWKAILNNFVKYVEAG